MHRLFTVWPFQVSVHLWFICDADYSVLPFAFPRVGQWSFIISLFMPWQMKKWGMMEVSHWLVRIEWCQLDCRCVCLCYLPLHHEVQKISSGTGWPGRKTVVCVCVMPLHVHSVSTSRHLCICRIDGAKLIVLYCIILELFISVTLLPPPQVVEGTVWPPFVHLSVSRVAKRICSRIFPKLWASMCYGWDKSWLLFRGLWLRFVHCGP